MEFKQVEQYARFPDTTIYWAAISDPPQEIQNQARKIDGEAYDPDGFGVCVFHDLSTHEFALMTEKAYPTNENRSIYYVDIDGNRHWFKADLAEEALKEIYDACEKITAGKMTENGYVITDSVRFDDGHGFALAEKTGAEQPFNVLKIDVDQYERWSYKSQGTFESAEAARSIYSAHIKSYEQFHSMMEADGITQTECGLIRHVNDPVPEQAMDVQTMQSPFQ